MALDTKRSASFLFVFLLATFLAAQSPTLADPISDKVSAVLYYETLCPGCSYFIVNDLKKLVKDHGLMSIVDLNLVPYGNAVTINGTISCQHGETECRLNTMEACVMDAAPSVVINI